MAGLPVKENERSSEEEKEQGSESKIKLINCKVCQWTYFGKKNWLTHLTLEGGNHVEFTRKRWEEWFWRVDSCLIIYSSEVLSCEVAAKIVDYFGDEMEVDKCNMVWWGREDVRGGYGHIGILKFRNRKWISRVLTKFNLEASSIIQIGQQRILVKAGLELKGLEWEQILEGWAPKVYGNHATHFLQIEYLAMREAMCVPEVHFKEVKDAVFCIQSILNERDWSWKLEIFWERNWLLRLRYPEIRKDNVLVYLYDLNEGDPSLMRGKIEEYLKEEDNPLRKIFKLVKSGEDRLTLKKMSNGVLITVVTGMVRVPQKIKEGFEEERSLCRLMEYVSRFDGRCQDVIALACYVVRLNGIRVGGDGGDEEELPGEYTIPWLVLTFLGERNEVPGWREVLEKTEVPGGKLEEYLKKWRDGDREWRGEGDEQFVLEVLELFVEFLYWMRGELRGRDWGRCPLGGGRWFGGGRDDGNGEAMGREVARCVRRLRMEVREIRERMEGKREEQDDKERKEEEERLLLEEAIKNFYLEEMEEATSKMEVEGGRMKKGDSMEFGGLKRILGNVEDEG